MRKQLQVAGGLFEYESRAQGDVLDIYQISLETDRAERIVCAEYYAGGNLVYVGFDCVEFGRFNESAYLGELWNSNVEVAAAFLIGEYMLRARLLFAALADSSRGV